MAPLPQVTSWPNIFNTSQVESNCILSWAFPKDTRSPHPLSVSDPALLPPQPILVKSHFSFTCTPLSHPTWPLSPHTFSSAHLDKFSPHTERCSDRGLGDFPSTLLLQTGARDVPGAGHKHPALNLPSVHLGSAGKTTLNCRSKRSPRH